MFNFLKKTLALILLPIATITFCIMYGLHDGIDQIRDIYGIE